MIKSKTHLLIELERISKVPEDYPIYSVVRIFALALAYILNDIVPDDRTTKRVFER